MQINIFSDDNTLYDEVAQLFIKNIAHNPKLTLGLATGSTPIKLYEKLIKDHQINQTNYEHIITYNLDEYVGIAPTHPQSYYDFMHSHFFSKININPSNIHMPVIVENQTHHQACLSYDHLLFNHQIDIQLLGIGSNGHIGFNEPGTPFDSNTHVIELDKKTRMDNSRFFEHFDDVPTHAITMGISQIMSSKTIVLIALGKQKSMAVKMMIEGPINTNCPASILQKHPDVKIFLDTDAASLLSSSL